MGMYDHVTCEVSLPGNYLNQNTVFQSKTTPTQMLDDYNIDTQGYLLKYKYDIIPARLYAEWKRWKALNPTGKFDGYDEDRGVETMMSINHRWEKTDFTGVINFYVYKDCERAYTEFSADFVNGVTDKINLVKRQVTFLWCPGSERAFCTKIKRV